jgi:hypothetical protein
MVAGNELLALILILGPRQSNVISVFDCYKKIVEYSYKRYCAAPITAPIFFPTEYSTMNRRSTATTKNSLNFELYHIIHSANLVCIGAACFKSPIYWRSEHSFCFGFSGHSGVPVVPAFRSFQLSSRSSSPFILAIF